MNSDQFQDFRRDCWHAKRATGSHINFFYSTERRVTISEEWDRTLFIVQAQFLRFTRHCLSHCQKLKSVPILVSWMRADRDVPIPSSSIPVPGVFAHWIHKSTWQFQLQAQSSALGKVKNLRESHFSHQCLIRPVAFFYGPFMSLMHLCGVLACTSCMLARVPCGESAWSTNSLQFCGMCACVDLNAYFLPPLLKHVFWSTQTSSFRHDVMQMFQGQTSKWPASPEGCQ